MLGISNGCLADCPDSPNCVCSDNVGTAHAIEPFHLNNATAGAWSRIERIVRELPRTRVVSCSTDYLHAECSSAFFGFVDDLELHLRWNEGTIAVRSASRLGYSDLGVNRRRVERLRAILRAQDILR